MSFLSSVWGYFFPNKEDDDNDESREEYLAEQLLELEFNEPTEYDTDVVTSTEIPRNTQCFQRSGVISDIYENYVLIDGMLYCDLSACSLKLNLNDKVLYLGYKDANDTIVVVRILENQGAFWGDEVEAEENNFKVIKHVIIGEVESRQDRFVIIRGNDLKFNLDDVEATFIPIKGDWLELNCSVQFDEDKPAEISAAQVLQVTSFKPLRRKVKSAVVTDWFGEDGICDRHIYFNKHCIQNGIEPRVGMKAMVEAIESDQGKCTWRGIKIILKTGDVPTSEAPKPSNEEEITLNVEKERCITATYPVKLENVDINESASTSLNITNNSDQVYTINKWIMLSKRKDSQVEVKPFLHQPKKLYPNQTFSLTITCNPKFLGCSKECLIVMFRGFQIKRFIEINITSNDCINGRYQFNGSLKTEKDKLNMMRNIRKNVGNTFVPGVRTIKPAAFVPLRLAPFVIPERVWSAVLGDSEQTIYSHDFNQIIDRLERLLPCLTQDLNINNYTDKWHTLLYMEEIQMNISMRAYDTQKAFLIQCQEYLGLEVKGLSERRPSLIKGDRVIVKDSWDPRATQYEGYIHALKGDLVLMKFDLQFHESYFGSDVSVEFHFNRTIYRKAHQAINLAISNLGADVLFPTRLLSRPPQVPLDKLEMITWFYDKLNTGQKTAITNILAGESRPLPYCIFGPPGTGKTVTVIETILQILENIPDSRILVATPSNSAANLITERLLRYRNVFSSSMIRLIANHLLDNDSLPNVIKPFCCTLDIARENTASPKHCTKDGIQMNCPTSFVGRHRVTIGTCYCIGSLAQMGLPRNHFTHVVVDEAGQATEPEIMIPLSFVDKDNAQIILAGDPMQLGAIVLSKYCVEYNMNESFMSRVLDRYPYQRDFDAFENGFHSKLVTRLNENYRSLEEVLKLPSAMFYDGTLVAKINRDELWITKILDIIPSVLHMSDLRTGGIFVYGIRGLNVRAEESPSWYNPQEASMLALTTCKLYKKGVDVDDIGIITPYIAQIKYLRLLFDSMGLPQPKIGTVEEFQGQEKPIILISTVRSEESILPEDRKNTLGFVKNPKRLNVALTRAQVAAILFCNPHLLSKDPLWDRVIANAVNEDKYLGCNLPYTYNAEEVNKT